ncbi:hypothetical protein WKT02_04640 [Erysipelotrichaceae bacterium HCN-30851]
MKKVAMVISAGLLLTFLVYQGSMAFFHAQTEVGTRISAGTLGIDIVEESTNRWARKTDNGFDFEKVMPGSQIDSSAYIENVEDMTVYVRVTATKYWTDQDGNKLPDADASLITMNYSNTDDWIVIDDSENSNNEIMYFYYRKPLNPNEKTSDVIDGLTIDSKLSDQTYGNYKIHLSLDAEAVQTTDGIDAAMSEWGMTIETDENGNIKSVEE